MNVFNAIHTIFTANVITDEMLLAAVAGFLIYMALAYVVTLIVTKMVRDTLQTHATATYNKIAALSETNVVVRVLSIMFPNIN